MEALESLAEFISASKDGFAMGGLVLAVILGGLVIAKFFVRDRREKQEEERRFDEARRYDRERQMENEKARMNHAKRVFDQEFGGNDGGKS